MSTNSSITVKIGKIYRTVYCHWDGYPSYNGKILLHHYNSQKKAEKLVEGGDISSLGETVKKTKYYKRDMNRKGADYDYIDYSTYDEVMRYSAEEYNYLWDGRRWLVDGVPLTDELIANSE